MPTTVDSVRREIVVRTTPEHAFRLFTEGMDRWWPRSHHIGASPMKRIVLEPRTGGRWYSICEDNSICHCGQVVAWDPPARLVIGWQITAAWQYDASFLTEVEVTFTAQGAGETLVVLEHRDLERFGDQAADVRERFGSSGGWISVLDAFAREAAN